MTKGADLITMISFSGGRTSALMTKILCENIPADKRVVCFANTGKEHEKTLEFVNNCAIHFGVDVVWIEYCPDSKFKVVSFETAARKGEPYEALIRKRKYVPNAVTQYCTTELKVHPIKRYMQSLGHKEWYNAIGIRYDEPDRYRRLPNGCSKEPYESIAPLYDMRITNPDVLRFWKQQPFDLDIPEHLGNCDMCFLKSRHKLRRIIEEEPERSDWWIQMETLTGATFRNGLRLSDLKVLVERQPSLFDDTSELSCLCTVD